MASLWYNHLYYISMCRFPGSVCNKIDIEMASYAKKNHAAMVE